MDNNKEMQTPTHQYRTRMTEREKKPDPSIKRKYTYINAFLCKSHERFNKRKAKIPAARAQNNE